MARSIGCRERVLNSGSFVGSLIMSEPWDRPPIPTQADEDLQVLYAAVGAALSATGVIESELSHLYALLIGKMWKPEAYDQYYDEGHTCQRRITTLSNAGEAYFQKAP